MRVGGDPAAGNNGLYCAHSDHLGSAALLTTASGLVKANTTARYFPFRAAPTAGTSGRGFTGRAHNNLGANDLGLIYLNARYFVPAVGRFASADALVPDPARPG
ncbi:MAG: hypothetical protein ACRDHL_07110, partial [Candidatus Promineifilaceae bacterium]